VGDDQAPVLPGALAQPVTGIRIIRGRGKIQAGHGVRQFRIAPGGYRQDVFQPGVFRERQGFQRRHVIQRQQAPIRHQDHPPDRVARQQPLQERQQRGRFRGIARKHLMGDGQAFRRLHHTQ
jgi:hypothetical protein